MSMVLIVKQFQGMGDIIFTQTIAHDYIKEGYRILWPVRGEWVDGLRRAYPAIEFIDYKLLPINYEDKLYYEKDGFTHLPMRYSEWLMGRPYKYHMESKYAYLGKDWKRWKENAYPARDPRREWGLENKLEIRADEKYNFVATTFGSDASNKVEIKTNNDFRNVELSYVPGYSLFDWCKIIENAETIHAVSSSTLYLFELLLLKAKEVHLYVRHPIERDFSYVDFLFSKPYILHQ